jgi:hypothetical protein
LPGKDDTEMPPNTRAATLVAAFGQNYRSYQYVFADFLVEHLTDLARHYGGDLQQVVVLAVIGQKWLHTLRKAEESAENSASATAITASRLADITGIPRETVRRKLGLLQARGWVTQGRDGAWSLSVDEDGQDLPARRDHADFDQRARWRVARLVAALERLGGEPPTRR